MKYASPALAFLLGYLLMLAFWPVIARGHWHYPPECCSGKDCAPIPSDWVEITPQGYVVGGVLIQFKNARASVDERYHGCFQVPHLKKVLGCFFAPKTGS